MTAGSLGIRSSASWRRRIGAAFRTVSDVFSTLVDATFSRYAIEAVVAETARALVDAFGCIAVCTCASKAAAFRVAMIRAGYDASALGQAAASIVRTRANQSTQGFFTNGVIPLVFALFESAILLGCVEATVVGEAAGTFYWWAATGRLVWSSAVSAVSDVLATFVSAAFRRTNNAITALQAAGTFRIAARRRSSRITTIRAIAEVGSTFTLANIRFENVANARAEATSACGRGSTLGCVTVRLVPSVSPTL